MLERTFDWVPRHDPRSRAYPATAGLPTTPRSYTWGCGAWLDQGREGACVGHGWAHEIAARPKVHAVTSADAFALYRKAQTLDEWPGEDYEGSSVLAGAKAVVQAGFIKSYAWCFGIDDVVLTIGRRGPVVLGVPWLSDMFEPDADGFIHATGGEIGGHCLLARGVNLPGQYVTLRNSWGRDWGRDGDCRISFNDLEVLLLQGGEACIPSVRL